MARARRRKKLSAALAKAIRAVTRTSERRFASAIQNSLRQKIGLAAKSKGSRPTKL